MPCEGHVLVWVAVVLVVDEAVRLHGLPRRGVHLCYLFLGVCFVGGGGECVSCALRGPYYIPQTHMTHQPRNNADLEVGIVALVDEELAVRHGAFGAECRQHLFELAEEEVAPHLREALVRAQPDL